MLRVVVSIDMRPNNKLANEVEVLMAKMPAGLPGRRMQGRHARWTPKLTQREVDMIWAALGHHEYYCRYGHHDDVAGGSEVVKRLAVSIFDPAKVGPFEVFDPYGHLDGNPKAREFIMQMDLHTLQEVIVKVMTDLWRRRQKYLGGDAALARRAGIKETP